MGERHWQIGVCGTFDVANYGDLLFPLIAESELTERLGAVTLHRFSYGTRTPPHWPYEVTSVAALPQMIRRLDGLLIGGGFLIRFDKQVAPGYAPPAPEIHHPTGYWLTPALLALQHDVPLVWNAPGMHCNEIPAWAHPLMKMALSLSRYVSVRDEPSGAALARLSGSPIAVVPDTAFRIPRLLDLDARPSAGLTRLLDASGLTGSYIVVQATLGVEEFVRFVKRHAARLRGFRFVALPVGPVLGEHAAIVDADLPGVVRLREWPDPLVIAELIARSDAVVGHSYHLMITALASGVPVFTRQSLATGKYTTLQHFETIFPLPADGETDPDWFLSRIGRTAPSAAARATHGPLNEHWNRIAAALRMDAPNTSVALNRFWQSLPTLLEDAALGHDGAVVAFEAERAGAHARLNETTAALIAARVETAEAHARLRETAAHLQETTAQLTAARADTIEARAGLQETTHQLQETTRQLQETTRQTQETTGQLTAVRAEAARSQARLHEVAAQLTASEAETADVQSRLHETTAQLTVARAEASDAQARLREVTAQLTVARADAAAARAEGAETGTRLDEALKRLDETLKHLDISRSEGVETQKRLDEALQHLAAAHSDTAGRQERLDDAARLLAVARAEADARDRRIAEIMASTSWRLTAPVRFVGHRLRTRP